MVSVRRVGRWIRTRAPVATTESVLRDAGAVGGPPGASGLLGLRTGSVRADIQLARALTLFAAGRTGSGTARAVESVLRRQPRSAAALAVQRRLHLHRGEISAALASTTDLLAVHDTPRMRRAGAKSRGLLRETDPAWLPLIADPDERITPRDANAVMHLLKVSLPYRTSGYSIRSQRTLLAQRDAGLDPFAVTSLGFPRNGGADVVEALEMVDSIKHYRLDLGAAVPDSMPLDEQLSRAADMAASIARTERPAIIHASSGFRGYDLALVGLALRRSLGIPMVYEVRGFFDETWTGQADDADSGELYERRLATEKRVMLAADAVMTISETMRDELVRRGIPRESITLAPNGIDPDQFTPRPADPDLLARLGLRDYFVAGYISNLDHPREQVEVLIRALARLRTDGRHIKALVVGDGSRRAELEREAASAGIADGVVFTGRVSNAAVADYYALIDAFVVPRMDDMAGRYTTPLKPFEAMAMQRPLLVSDVPALRDIVGNGERGLIFPAGDAKALASLLARLMDHRDERDALAAEGRRWVLAERTWRANGERYNALYASILGRSPA